jgi:hypothetical protein
MSPGAIPGKEVLRFIPRLRFSSPGKKQLQAENNQEETKRSDFISLGAFIEMCCHLTLFKSP